MDYSEKWKIIESLGEGGQGKVYRVTDKNMEQSLEKTAANRLRDAASTKFSPKIQLDNFKEFRELFRKLAKLEEPSNQGALKVLHNPEDARDAQLAEERIKREIEAMSENLHPNLIKIIDVDPKYKWYVSEFYPNGHLANKLKMFKGDFFKALKAFRPLVKAVAILHEKGYVHRDIKPQNIFLNSINDLILGDFGLVYFEDPLHKRISATFENVGSRDWMPYWAQGFRIDEVKPSFDVFSLGKLLWAMTSGQPVLQLWYFDRDRFNLEKLFPKSRFIKFANSLFSKCIVEEEKDCIPDAGSLLEEIDQTMSIIELNADRIDKQIKRPCKVCGIGKYILLVDENLTQIRNFGLNPAGTRQMKIFTCSHCGHVQLFTYSGEQSKVWQSRIS